MALPTGKQVSSGEYDPVEPGTYQVKLMGVDLEISTEFKSTLRYQSAVLHWLIEDEEQEWREKFVKVSLNENSRLYNRLSALAGAPIGEEGTVEWRVSPQAQTGCVLDDYYRNQEGELVGRGEKADGIIGHVDDLIVNGESVIGKECLMAIEVNESGYNRAKAGAATALPKKRKGAKQEGVPAGAPA